VAEVRRCIQALEITPDERMRKQMATWPDVSDSFIYRTGVHLSESVKFEVVVRPAGDGGYFLALTFAAAGDARRAVWDPSFKAATKTSKEDEKDRQTQQVPSGK
jgi:hypothetical protein